MVREPLLISKLPNAAVRYSASTQTRSLGRAVLAPLYCGITLTPVPTLKSHARSCAAAVPTSAQQAPKARIERLLGAGARLACLNDPCAVVDAIAFERAKMCEYSY